MKKNIVFLVAVLLVGCGDGFGGEIEKSGESGVVIETEQEKRQKEGMEREKRQEDIREVVTVNERVYGIEDDLFLRGPVLTETWGGTTVTYLFPGKPLWVKKLTPTPSPFAFYDPLDYEDHYKAGYQLFMDYIEGKPAVEYGAGQMFWGAGAASSFVFEIPVEFPEMKHARAIVSADGQEHPFDLRMRIFSIDQDDNIWIFEESLTYEDFFMKKMEINFIFQECESALEISRVAAYDCVREKKVYLDRSFVNEEELLKHLTEKIQHLLGKTRFKRR